ncbi:hypothetical protein HELRODRAFT_169215 [Helobdella robusta]|uniref:Endonuclease/exonuclease/phosphatase domain-containing protein n=1 Tax=Helobdella robusta TaxID=6412 RepID=T1F1L2_HELRO|nr:hypothetical protein HELRODRAFT_169215 [Helobdella robusta]ESO08390.1 hypothetical protein HELRODRAFT_169215 [Helobdella robusta]
MFPRNNLVTNSYCLKFKKFSTEDDDVDRNRDNTMMKLGLLNVRSLSNKSVVIYDALLHNKIDVIVLTETWHRASNDDSVKSALPLGYGYVDAVREFDPAHGGLIVMVKDVYSLRRLDIPKLTSFECLCVQISMANTPVILMAIYRPGSKGADKLFFDELSHVVERLIVNNVPLLIAGDFNIHLEDADDLNARRMEDFFATFDMIRFVHGPTHVKNGTLDFVAATSSYEITDVTVGTPGEFSDHALITCLLPMQKIKPKMVTKLVRCNNELAAVFTDCIKISIINHNSKTFSDVMRGIKEKWKLVNKTRSANRRVCVGDVMDEGELPGSILCCCIEEKFALEWELLLLVSWITSGSAICCGCAHDLQSGIPDMGSDGKCFQAHLCSWYFKILKMIAFDL